MRVLLLCGLLWTHWTASVVALTLPVPGQPSTVTFRHGVQFAAPVGPTANVGLPFALGPSTSTPVLVAGPSQSPQTGSITAAPEGTEAWSIYFEQLGKGGPGTGQLPSMEPTVTSVSVTYEIFKNGESLGQPVTYRMNSAGSGRFQYDDVWLPYQNGIILKYQFTYQTGLNNQVTTDWYTFDPVKATAARNSRDQFAQLPFMGVVEKVNAATNENVYRIVFGSKATTFKVEFVDVHLRLNSNPQLSFSMKPINKNYVYEHSPVNMVPGDYLLYSFTYKEVGKDFNTDTQWFAYNVEAASASPVPNIPTSLQCSIGVDYQASMVPENEPDMYTVLFGISSADAGVRWATLSYKLVGPSGQTPESGQTLAMTQVEEQVWQRNGVRLPLNTTIVFGFNYGTATEACVTNSFTFTPTGQSSLLPITGTGSSGFPIPFPNTLPFPSSIGGSLSGNPTPPCSSVPCYENCLSYANATEEYINQCIAQCTIPCSYFNSAADISLDVLRITRLLAIMRELRANQEVVGSEVEGQEGGSTPNPIQERLDEMMRTIANIKFGGDEADQNFPTTSCVQCFEICKSFQVTLERCVEACGTYCYDTNSGSPLYEAITVIGGVVPHLINGVLSGQSPTRTAFTTVLATYEMVTQALTNAVARLFFDQALATNNTDIFVLPEGALQELYRVLNITGNLVGPIRNVTEEIFGGGIAACTEDLLNRCAQGCVAKSLSSRLELRTCAENCLGVCFSEQLVTNVLLNMDAMRVFRVISLVVEQQRERGRFDRPIEDGVSVQSQNATAAATSSDSLAIEIRRVTAMACETCEENCLKKEESKQPACLAECFTLCQEPKQDPQQPSNPPASPAPSPSPAPGPSRPSTDPMADMINTFTLLGQALGINPGRIAAVLFNEMVGGLIDMVGLVGGGGIPAPSYLPQFPTRTNIPVGMVGGTPLPG